MREIQRERLADQAYEVLRDRILTRALAPGQRLSVPLLAEELGLSRSPVREAVQRLVREGLSTERPRQGAVVASAQIDELQRLYQVRAALEGLSAALATERSEPGLVDALAATLDDQRRAFEAGDEAAVIRADGAFHARLLAAAANPELTRTLDPILGRVSVAMLAGDLRTWPARALREHQEIIDAVAAGDGALARSRSEDHVLRVRERLIDKLSDDDPTDARQNGDGPGSGPVRTPAAALHLPEGDA